MFSTFATDLKTWLRRGLASIGAASALLVVAVVLWGLLSLLGDETGAMVARGASLTAGVAVLGCLSALVLLLAWDRLAAGES